MSTDTNFTNAGIADALLVETVERLLDHVSTQDEVEHAETNGWSKDMWDLLAAAGFPWVGIDEAWGGSGGTLYDIAAIVRAVGSHAAPVPIAETAMLGGWLLAQAGLTLPEGPVSVVDSPGHVDDGRLHVDGVAAWARHADLVVVAVEGGRVVAIPRERLTVSEGANLAGEARDHVSADLALAGLDSGEVDDALSVLSRRGSLSRTILAAGALATVAQMTVDYTNERRQFGKPVATFQAVQMHLVTATQCAVKAKMAADVAVRAVVRGDGRFEIATARVVVDDAITVGTRAAHQAHGAMGVTREYPLHQFTRRLWSWRQEWGTTRQWRHELGSGVAAAGADGLFDLITDRTP